MATALVATPLALALTNGCRSPTEITLTVTTDVKCADFSGAAITVGSAADVETKAPATVTTTCSNSGSVGSLVIVPSGSDDDEVTIRVAGGVDRDPTTCADDGDLTGCIIVRRQIRFEPHTAQVVALALETACSGVACVVSQTCVAGMCLSDVGDPAEEGADAGASDATVTGDADAAPSSSDALAPTDAVSAESGDSSSGPGLFDAGPEPDAAAPSPPCTDGSEPGAPWASTRRCGTNDARSPYPGTAGTPTPTLVCSSLGGAPLTPLAIDALGLVYMGATDGTLHVLSRALDDLASTSVGTRPLLSAVVASDGILYVSSATTVYKVEVNGPEGDLIVLDERSFVVAGDGGVDGGTAPIAPVLASNGDLVLPGADQIFGYGAPFAEGPAWTFTAPSATSMLGALGIAPDGTLLGSFSGLPLYALGSDGGVVALSQTVAPGGTLVSGLGHVYAWSEYGVAPIDGKSVPLFSIMGMALQSKAAVVTYNPGGKGSLGFFDPALASLENVPVSSAPITSAPVVDANDAIYFVTGDGKLNVCSGSMHTVKSVAGASTANPSPSPIIGNGAVYLGGIANGGVCVYQ